MSTGGKVLVVLVILVLPIWVILVSGVAHLNTEWTQSLVKLRAQVEQLKPQVEANETRIQELKDQIVREQENALAEQTVILTKIAELERSRAETIQVQTALVNQLATVQAAVEAAKAGSERRKQELEAEQAEKDKAIANVTQLNKETSELLDELANLSKDFKQTLELNRRLVEHLNTKARPKPTTRAARYERVRAHGPS